MKYLIKNNNLRIIYYHMISGSTPEYYPINGSINKDTFQWQLKFLKKNFNIISIDEAVYKINNNIKFNKNLIITFDDGFSSIYKNAIPILDDYKIPSCIYLISDCVLKNKMMWRNILFFIQNNFKNLLINNICSQISDEFKINQKTQDKNLLSWSMSEWPMNKRDVLVKIFLDELSINIDQYMNDHQPYMQRKELLEILNSGHTLGTHSASHPNFSKLNYFECEKEILESKQGLESHLESKINHFSYPFGVRMDKSFEEKFILNHSNSIKSMAGIKFKFKESKDTYQLERDKMEVNKLQSMLRLYALPYFRRFIGR